MVLLQDWASEDVLAGPFLPDRVEHGYDPARGTNRRLKQRLSTHLGLELKDIYATRAAASAVRSEEHTSELHHQIISYAVFCLKKKKKKRTDQERTTHPPCTRNTK